MGGDHDEEGGRDRSVAFFCFFRVDLVFKWLEIYSNT
jgi:hypothetical protein